MPDYRSKTSTHGRNMAGARGLWRATGMKDEDFGKPIIAVVNSFTQFVPGHVHLKDLGQLVARQIEQAGGVAKEFNTIAVDDGIAMGHDGMLYSLPSRDLIADSVEYMVNALTKDSAYYNDLRGVYVTYDFKKELFEQLNAKYGVNFPTETETDKKSDAWFTQVKNAKGELVDEVDHYYYITVVNEQTTYVEIANPEDAPEGVNVFPVYKSSEWLFSRYSDDTGGKITTVRAKYMPYWKDLISTIPFVDWIYDSSNKVYNVDFSRSYYLQPTFRVYDTEGD